MLTSICRSIVTICSGLYLWMGMTRFSSKWILSHSTWSKNRRSRHTVDLLAPVMYQILEGEPVDPHADELAQPYCFVRRKPFPELPTTDSGLGDMDSVTVTCSRARYTCADPSEPTGETAPSE